jgi:hypothetical protein
MGSPPISRPIPAEIARNVAFFYPQTLRNRHKSGRFHRSLASCGYRLLGWDYKPGQIKHPGYMGKFINKFVYDGLPPGVAEELKKRLPKNENGNRKAKLWQQLTVDTGNPHLDQQLKDDLLLMRIADDRASFERSWEKAFGTQGILPLIITKQLKAEN